MNKSSITHVVVMIIAISISSWLASSLQTEQTAISKNRTELTSKTLCGFNKFTADIQWMFFVNYCGRLNAISSENSEVVYNKLTTILNNDPDFLKAYLIGGLMLSSSAPLQAFDVFQRGVNNPRLKTNSKLPFLAGYVLIHDVKDKDWNELCKKNKDLPDRLTMAEKMFKTAVERESTPPYHYVSSMMRTRGMRFKQRGKFRGIKVINAHQAYTLALFDYWQKNKRTYSEQDRTSSSSIPIESIEKRLLSAIQFAKSEFPDNKDIARTIKLITNKVFHDEHICSECFHPYAPGDKYCSSCGKKVVVYGTCQKCGEVLKGDYCSKCGAKAK